MPILGGVIMASLTGDTYYLHFKEGKFRFNYRNQIIYQLILITEKIYSCLI